MRARLLLLAAALLAFGASLGSSFHFDDYAIFSDPALESTRGWIEVWAPLQTRPLTYFTFWLNRQIGGGDPLGLSPLQPVLSSGRRAAGLGMPAPLAAGARGLDRGRALRPASHTVRSCRLRLGAEHPAGGPVLLCRALPVAPRAALGRGRVLRRRAARQGGMRGVSAAAGLAPLARQFAGRAEVPGGAGRHVRARAGRRRARHLGDHRDPRHSRRRASRHFPVPVSSGAGRRDLALPATGRRAVRIYGRRGRFGSALVADCGMGAARGRDTLAAPPKSRNRDMVDRRTDSPDSELFPLPCRRSFGRPPHVPSDVLLRGSRWPCCWRASKRPRCSPPSPWYWRDSACSAPWSG